MSRGHFVRDHVPIHVHRCSDVNLKSVNQVGDGTQTARTPRTFTYDSLSELITAANGESGTICYGIWSSATCINGYDADGNLLHKTDARGMTVNYGYDAINRLTIKTYSDGSASREFYYDAANHGYSVGRLTHASNDVNDAFDPSYDKMGRIIGETWCIPSACDYTTHITAEYDLAGNMKSLTYPSGRKVTFRHDNGANRLSLVNYDSYGSLVNYDSYGGSTVNSPYFTATLSPSAWAYWPAGSLRLGTYGNGVQETVSFNNRLQASAILQTNTNNSQVLFNKSYTYPDASHGNGNNGNVMSIIDNLTSAKTQSFSYDQLNRILNGSQSDGGFNVSLSYDQYGNMNSSGTWGFQNAFDQNNRLSGWNYDAAGNLQWDGAHSYAYDAESRVKTIDGGGATYTYGPDGERVRKDVGGSFTEYLYLNGQVIAEKNAVGWTDYIFADGKLIAKSTSSAIASNQYYHADHLESTRLMTDSVGSTVSNCIYAPFGQEVSCSPGNVSNHYKFTGKERDTESNLDYFGARYYAASMGRWMSPDWSEDPDPIPYADLEDPQTLNLYTYVRNNPIGLNDLDGHLMLRTPNECYYKCKWEHTDYLQKAMLFTQLVIAVEYQLFFSKDRKASTPPAVPAEDTKSASPPANSGNNQDKKGDKESKAKQDAEKARDSKKADEQISGSAKRSKSYHSEYGDKTLGELKELAKGGDRKAAQMKKLIENAERLSQKRPK